MILEAERLKLDQAPLLADAKATEYFAQQIVSREFARDLAKRFMREPQFLSEQFQRNMIKMSRRSIDVRKRRAKRGDMAFACHETTFLPVVETDSVGNGIGE